MNLEALPAAAQGARPPINLAFVIDRSGSMQGDKIVKAREAVIHGIGSLRDGDRFSVVAFDHEVEVVVASKVSTGAGRQNAIAAVRRVEPRGRTKPCGGWLQGCSEIGEHLTNEAIGRCILLTDGLTNEGIIELDEIRPPWRIWHATSLGSVPLGHGSPVSRPEARPGGCRERRKSPFRAHPA